MTPAEYKRELAATAVEIARYRDMLADLLDKADDLLQSDDMPEPWDRWDDPIYEVQSAANDMRDGTAIGRAVRHLNAAYAAVEKAEQ